MRKAQMFVNKFVFVPITFANERHTQQNVANIEHRNQRTGFERVNRGCTSTGIIPYGSELGSGPWDIAHANI
jgi:hypothetical protein